jgi:hypothetical protein
VSLVVCTRCLLLSVALDSSTHVFFIQLIQLLQAKREDAEHVLLLFFRQLAIKLQQALFVRLKSVFLILLPHRKARQD